jgi:hypothetical protein
MSFLLSGSGWLHRKTNTSFLLLNERQDTVTSLLLVRHSSRLFIFYLCFDIRVIMRQAKEYFRTMFPFFGVLMFKQLYIFPLLKTTSVALSNCFLLQTRSRIRAIVCTERQMYRTPNDPLKLIYPASGIKHKI